MLKTELSLDVSTTLNPKIMRLFDTSHYCTDEEVDNYLVEVLAVNMTNWLTFHVAKGFSLALNSSNLRYLKVTESAGLVELPDGIYEFKQSITPNIHTLSYYLHFRIVLLLSKIETERCKLLGEKCSISREEYIKNRDILRDIEEYAYSSKWMVEEENDKVKGKELYELATKLLEQYTNECQCS